MRNIPQALLDLGNIWVNWDQEAGNKKPINSNGGPSYGEEGESLADVTHAANVMGYGIGFRIRKDNNIIVLDVDKISNKRIHNLSGLPQDVQDLVNDSGTYAEISPSGKGVHIIGFGAKPGKRSRSDGYELYDEKRYMTFSGNRISPEGNVKNVDWAPIYEKYISKGRKEVNGGGAVSEGESNMTPAEAIAFLKADTRTAHKAAWEGDLDGKPSKSEVQFALIDAILFYLGLDAPVEDVKEVMMASPFGRERLLGEWAKKDFASEVKRAKDSYDKAKHGFYINFDEIPDFLEEDDLAPEEEEKEYGEISERNGITRALGLPIKRTLKKRWILEDIMEQAPVMTIYGDSGSGKTMITNFISLCIAGMRDTVCGNRRVKHGMVVYIAYESQDSLELRIMGALEHEYDFDMDAKIKLMEKMVRFRAGSIFINSAEHTKSIIKECKQLSKERKTHISMVVLDTMQRSVMDKDLNSATDVAMVLDNAAMIHRKTGATVAFVHHTGNMAGDRERGSSALRGNIDARYVVKKHTDGFIMEAKKIKDGEVGQQILFKKDLTMVPVENNFDETNETSVLVIKSADFAPFDEQPADEEPEEKPAPKNEYSGPHRHRNWGNMTEWEQMETYVRDMLADNGPGYTLCKSRKWNELCKKICGYSDKHVRLKAYLKSIRIVATGPHRSTITSTPDSGL